MDTKSAQTEVDNGEIKKLLQSFREGTEDTDDPAFREALAKLESDLDLAAWFRAEQAFDAAMVKTFREVPVQTAVKEAILRGARRSE